MEERDGDRRCPETPFVTNLVHDYGEEGRVSVAGEVGVFEGVCLENGGAEEADREKEHMGKGDTSLWCKKK